MSKHCSTVAQQYFDLDRLCEANDKGIIIICLIPKITFDTVPEKQYLENLARAKEECDNHWLAGKKVPSQIMAEYCKLVFTARTETHLLEYALLGGPTVTECIATIRSAIPDRDENGAERDIDAIAHGILTSTETYRIINRFYGFEKLYNPAASMTMPVEDDKKIRSNAKMYILEGISARVSRLEQSRKEVTVLASNRIDIADGLVLMPVNGLEGYSPWHCPDKKVLHSPLKEIQKEHLKKILIRIPFAWPGQPD